MYNNIDTYTMGEIYLKIIITIKIVSIESGMKSKDWREYGNNKKNHRINVRVNR